MRLDGYLAKRPHNVKREFVARLRFCNNEHEAVNGFHPRITFYSQNAITNLHRVATNVDQHVVVSHKTTELYLQRDVDCMTMVGGQGDFQLKKYVVLFTMTVPKSYWDEDG